MPSEPSKPDPDNSEDDPNDIPYVPREAASPDGKGENSRNGYKQESNAAAIEFSQHAAVTIAPNVSHERRDHCREPDGPTSSRVRSMRWLDPKDYGAYLSMTSLIMCWLSRDARSRSAANAGSELRAYSSMLLVSTGSERTEGFTLRNSARR